MNPQFTLSKVTIAAMKLALELSKTVPKGTLSFGTAVILGTDGKHYTTPPARKPK